MHFKVGERVTFLRESGYGVIQSIKNEHSAIVEDETGFDRVFPMNELVKIHGDQTNAIADDFDATIVEQDAELNDASNDVDDIRKYNSYWEIDLHIHEILESEAGLTNKQMLDHQIYALRRFYRNAREKRIRKIIIIHGVGQGVLKNEVRDFLEGQDGLEVYDADFREYGKGATAVELFYK
ncbi:MAG: Smr/MutS family protein [Brumimicrobium sp.]